MIAETELNLRRKPEEADWLTLSERDFTQAKKLAETLDPKKRVDASAHIGINLARANLDPYPVLEFLREAQHGIALLTTPEDLDELHFRRDAIYAEARIHLALGDPELAFVTAGKDPYPGNPHQPGMDVEIAKGYAKQGLDPTQPFERAISVGGKSTWLAPIHTSIDKNQRLSDEIMIAEAMAEAGKDPTELLEKIYHALKDSIWRTIPNRKQDDLAFSFGHGELARAYASGGNIKAALSVIDEGEDNRKREGQRLVRDSLLSDFVAEENDAIKADLIKEVADALLKRGDTEVALTTIQQGGSNLDIADVAAKAAVTAASKGEDANRFVQIALEHVNKQQPPNTDWEENHSYVFQAHQAKILAFIGQASENPEPMLLQAINIAQFIKPSPARIRSDRSFVWNQIGQSLDRRGYDAERAFKKAVDLLFLQHGARIAQSRLGDWDGQTEFGARGHSGWKYFKSDLVSFANIQLEHGYFDTAQESVDRFREVDTERRFFEPLDEAIYLSTRALAFARQV